MKRIVTACQIVIESLLYLSIITRAEGQNFFGTSFVISIYGHFTDALKTVASCKRRSVQIYDVYIFLFLFMRSVYEIQRDRGLFFRISFVVSSDIAVDVCACARVCVLVVS